MRPVGGISRGFVLTLCAIAAGIGILSLRALLSTKRVYSEPPIVFDTCGFATQADCRNDPSCVPPDGYPDACYKSKADGWCCPRGCTAENICGDTQITDTEECDGGGQCVGGGMGGQACRTLIDVQKCVARGGVCTAQNGDGDFCNALCESEIASCGNAICEPLQGETCRNCKPDCGCTSGQICNAAGQCAYSGGGGYCGDGIRQSVEQCDDGNILNGDGCKSNCKCEACGDGYKCHSEQCDDGNLGAGDGCSPVCKIEPSCSDGKRNQGETQVDCGGPNCPACPCTLDGHCNDGLYCTVDQCVTGTCQYTAFNGGTNVNPCKKDFPRLCATPSNCFCNENTNACELCTATSQTDCKATTNTLCQDHGNPTGCYEKSPGNWCCPGRE